MKWFSKQEFDKVKALIDKGNSANAIGDWYWSDFRNNATTLAMAYIYAKMNNNKCSKCITKLESLLTPKKKTGPLEYNDVVTEIWNHDNTKAIKSINILIDNNIPFQVKNGDVVLEFLTNPKLQKVKDAIEKRPRIISRYMKSHQLDKIKSYLLSSSDYEMVRTGMSSEAYFAKRDRNRAYKKSSISKLLRHTMDIKNDANRLRYIKEEIFNGKNDTAEDLFNDLLSVYMATKFTVDDIVDILSGLSDYNVGNSTPTKLFHKFDDEGHEDKVREIVKNWKDSDIWRYVYLDFRVNRGATHPAYDSSWVTPYLDLMSVDSLYNIIDMIPSAKDDSFVTAVLNKFPDSVDIIMKKFPDRLPQVMKDVFIF